MLKRYATFVSLFRSVSDVFIIGCVWLCVFYVRFHSGVFAAAKGIPDFKKHLDRSGNVLYSLESLVGQNGTGKSTLIKCIAGQEEFEGTIETIADGIWTMTIDGELRTVDVSATEIVGEPAVGLEAEVTGTVADDETIVASKVEIKES